MSDAAPAQVLDLIVARLRAWEGLAGWTIVSDIEGQTEDKVFEEGDYPLVSVAVTDWQHDNAFMQGQTQHDVEYEFEVVSGKETPGVIARTNMNAIAHVIGALSEDRTFGGVIEDIQETGVSRAGPNGIDAGASVLVTRAQFYTPRKDWFTLATP